ncbi:helix-turn-helix domain-containing protein [Blautia liquoris]|jgi:transcriptional regulator with XRE-family HTH domain|uniref:helix-turn-helix domain-containing protein n=1 Tax=Blautia liquoris TaxID=2779518 RepID=UPI002E33B907|nr:helix-turn-helix transcriptional regulator [Blautia liquoris]
MDAKKIGEFLKALRKDKGLTQEQLAEIICVSGRTISRWETGTNMPDLSILIQMAEFYKVEVKEILDGERKSESMDKELKLKSAARRRLIHI